MNYKKSRTMKNIIYPLVIIIFLTATIKSEAKNGRPYLEMEGVVKQNLYLKDDAETVVSGATFTILDEKKRIAAIWYSNNFGKCIFKVQLNRRFEILVSKKGYVTKKLTLNTWLPKDKAKAYVLHFDIYLFEIVQGLDVSVLKDPIAKIMFDNPTKSFIYNNSYTEKINEKLRSVYTEYYVLNHDSYLKRLAAARYDSLKKSDSIPSFALKNTTNTKTEAPASIDKTGKDSITFHIQLIAVNKKLPITDSPVFSSCGPVSEQCEDGIFKYTTGHFSTYESAESHLPEIISLGFKDAFIIAKKGGKRININLATNSIRK